jgi:hypothetical protein
VPQGSDDLPDASLAIGKIFDWQWKTRSIDLYEMVGI